jgi:VWFA-related protein
MKASGPMMAVLAALAGWAQSPPTIRVPVRVVQVPTAVVSSSGHVVRGLRAGDFRLFDNDRPQNVRIDYVDEPLSLAIVVQNGDTVRAWLPEVRRSASTVEALLTGETGEASVTTFADDITHVQTLTTSGALLDRAFQAISPSIADKQRTLDAVLGAARQLEQVPAQRRRAVLLIAQSGDVGSVSNLRDVLRELELNNIVVYSLVMPRIGKALVQKTISLKDAKSTFHRDDVGFVAGVDLGKLVPEIYRLGKAGAGNDDLTVATRESGGRQIPFRKLHELEAGMSAIGEELHTEYLLSYTPDRYDPGYHRIRLEVSQARAETRTEVRARPGYYVLQSDVQE